MSEKEGWVKRMRYLQVQGICTAYESGFGHGLDPLTGLPNPYEDFTPEWQAYNIGYAEGFKKRSQAQGERGGTNVESAA